MGSTGTGTRNQSTQTQQSQSQTQNPWEYTIDPLKNVIGQLNGQLGNTGVNANETAAIDQLRAAAGASGQYTNPLQGIASDVMGQNRTGIASDAYSNYQNQVKPYTDPGYLNPYNNPAFQQYLETTSNDVANRVNGMYAAAGRDGSGYNVQNLARGIAEGTAPIFANQYNQNVATQRGAQDNLYNAGNSTAGLLSSLDQSRLSTGQAASQAGIAAQGYAPGQMLNIEQNARSLPLQNIGNVASLLTPLAGLGGTSTGNSYGSANSQMSYTQPLAQTVGQWAQAGMQGMGALSGIPAGMNGIGGGLQVGAGWLKGLGF